MTDEPDIIETDIEELEETLSREDFVARLRQLADALEKGDGFEVDLAGETVTLPKDAVYSVDYEGEDGEEEIGFRIAWSRADED